MIYSLIKIIFFCIIFLLLLRLLDCLSWQLHESSIRMYIFQLQYSLDDVIVETFLNAISIWKTHNRSENIDTNYKRYKLYDDAKILIYNHIKNHKIHENDEIT